MRKCRPAEVQHRGLIQGDHLIPEGIAALLSGCVKVSGTGVVNQHVNSPKGFDHLLHGGLAVLRIGCIA